MTSFLVNLRRWLLVAAALFAIAAPAAAQPDPGGLLVRSRPILGVNWWDLFQYHYLHPADRSYLAGMRALASHDIRVVRFAASPVVAPGLPPGLPLRREWVDHPARYWRAMDDVVRAAERFRLRLIPDLAWDLEQFAWLDHAAAVSIGDPHSRGAAVMREYVREVVGRYHRSPALLMWEAGNEYNLCANVDGCFYRATASQIERALVAIGHAIRRYDRGHLIESGDSVNRLAAWHLAHGGTWQADTPDEWAQMEERFNPFGVLSAHAYSEQDVAEVRQLVELGRQLHRPVIVGEFGVAGGDPVEYAHLLSEIESSGAAIALVWTYDTHEIRHDPWSATFTNRLAFELSGLSP